ncbi:hypothetical protein C7M84_006644 [Penaeus vannamei]|uniref:Major facilitator superfamily (MFS) profile domain-containing protein n=1 Tax=Penaeus vannamei TaxID=6689 RepID=A0A423TEL6_PENVA|nr:hypothetical protein C7M84_006644 [Penaeus vannamei]
MDESPRWLIVRGQFDRARRVLQRAARWNKTQLPSEEALNNLILSGSNYSADPFIYIVLGGLMEIPGFSLTAPIINRFGRKWPTIWGYVLSGIAILLLVFIPDNIQWLVMTLAMLGKLCNSGAFMIIFVYITEVLPTEVRLQGVSAAIMTSKVGAMVAPYVTDYVGPLVPWAPSVIFGVSSVVAGVALLPMHETLNVPMPDTIEDVPDITLKPTLFRPSAARGPWAVDVLPAGRAR